MTFHTAIVTSGEQLFGLFHSFFRPLLWILIISVAKLQLGFQWRDQKSESNGNGRPNKQNLLKVCQILNYCVMLRLFLTGLLPSMNSKMMNFYDLLSDMWSGRKAQELHFETFSSGFSVSSNTRTVGWTMVTSVLL